MAPNGKMAICDKDGGSPCCSLHGYCGSGDQYCCLICTDYRDYRQDGKCGENYPTWDDRPSICDPNSSTACCDDASGICVECSKSVRQHVLIEKTEDVVKITQPLMGNQGSATKSLANVVRIGATVEVPGSTA
ncbi:hypothetical protein HOLleu_15689 [Holothuria leucospilota]|uniref:Uncharacterized protein n=1 Tax=Holothuria leucospilota TaxID=206669 RepID=A0A9Q1C4J1_HOLLE|nr:hypothetical protein HOLleu_15689 [Holothuria leucospilota]